MTDHLHESGNETPSGISMMDVAGLPEHQARVILLLLREQNSADGVTLEMLKTHLNELEHVSEIVAELEKQGWLVTVGEDPDIRYRVVLRRRAHTRSEKMSNLLAMLGV